MNQQRMELTLQPVKKKKRKLLIALIVFLVAVAASSFWVAKEMFEKGEVEIPVPENIVKLAQEALQVEDLSIGPVHFGKKELSGLAKKDSPFKKQPYADENLDEYYSKLAMPKEQQEALSALPELQNNPHREKVYSGEDQIVTPLFVKDLAERLVHNYWPKGSHPAASGKDFSSASIQSLNQYYGLTLTGFASLPPAAERDIVKERSFILNYSFNSSILQALVHLYGDRFVGDMEKTATAKLPAADGGIRKLSLQERSQMFAFYAQKIRSIGVSLMLCAENQEVIKSRQNYLQREAEARMRQAEYFEAQYNLELAKGDKNKQVIVKAQENLDKAAQKHQAAARLHYTARGSLIKSLKQGFAKELDDNSLIYIAFWAHRRGENAGADLRAAAACAEYLAVLLEEKAKQTK